MVKVSTVIVVATSQNQVELSPFYIIRDYRKSLKLKKQRDLRKKKLILEKQSRKEVERSQRQNMIQQMNRSMLQEDDVWNKIQGDLKEESSEECYTNDHESEISKKIQRLRWEVLFTLGSVQKELLFEPTFQKFEFKLMQ